MLRLLSTDAERCYDHYEELLNEDDDGNPRRPGDPQLARELARMNPVSYTHLDVYKRQASK